MNDDATNSTAKPTLPASDADAAPATLPGIIDGLRQAVRQRHYAARTERAYVEWVHRFCAWFDGRPLPDLGEPEVRKFLADLATRTDVTTVQRNQARAALLMLFHDVLGRLLDCTDGLQRAQPDGSDGPAVLSRAQVAQLIAAVEPACGLPVALLYGTGLRLGEILTLRVRDIDLALGQRLQLRDPRTGRDLREVALPAHLVAPLQRHLDTISRRHETDLLKDAGYAQLPDEVRTVAPEASRSLGWQWAFQTGRLQRDPVTEDGRRPHMHEAVVQRALSAAGRTLGLGFPVTPQTLRHSFAMHANQDDGGAVAA